MPELEDDYDLRDDGTVHLIFSGIQRTLKRPTLGEYRELVEALGEEGSSSPGDSAVKIRVDQMVAWLDKVTLSLAGEGLPRTALLNKETGEVVLDEANNPVLIVDEKKLPSWVSGQELAVDLIRQWQTIPNRRGGQ